MTFLPTRPAAPKQQPAPEPAKPEPGGFEIVQWLTELRRDMTQTLNGVALKGARPVVVGKARGATHRPATSSTALMGFSLKNLSYDLPCTVELIDGADVHGDLILSVELSPGESAREWFGVAGIHLGQGLYFRNDDGLVAGAVFLRGTD